MKIIFLSYYCDLCENKTTRTLAERAYKMRNENWENIYLSSAISIYIISDVNMPFSVHIPNAQRCMKSRTKGF